MGDRETVTARRDELVSRLMAELTKRGYVCKFDGAMGAAWINIEGHREFVLEVEREWIKADRPSPNNFDYTGRLKIVCQGFGQPSESWPEPEDGFDLEAIGLTLDSAIRDSASRRDKWEADRARVNQAAIETAERLDEAANGPTVTGEAVYQDGQWQTRFDVKFWKLKEAEVGRLIAVLADN